MAENSTHLLNDIPATAPSFFKLEPRRIAYMIAESFSDFPDAGQLLCNALLSPNRVSSTRVEPTTSKLPLLPA
jgi:hypothetical protein